MKKPLKKDYCKPFSLDSSLVTFNAKAYAKDAEEYIKYLEKRSLKLIEDALREGLRKGNKISDISPYLITSQVRAFEIFTATKD